MIKIISLEMSYFGMLYNFKKIKKEEKVVMGRKMYKRWVRVGRPVCPEVMEVMYQTIPPTAMQSNTSKEFGWRSRSR